jgi:hypothetical protein
MLYSTSNLMQIGSTFMNENSKQLMKTIEMKRKEYPITTA